MTAIIWVSYPYSNFYKPHYQHCFHQNGFCNKWIGLVFLPLKHFKKECQKLSRFCARDNKVIIIKKKKKCLTYSNKTVSQTEEALRSKKSDNHFKWSEYPLGIWRDCLESLTTPISPENNIEVQHQTIFLRRSRSFNRFFYAS